MESYEKWIIGIIVLSLLLVVGWVAIGPMYNVWAKELSGKAQLAEAQWNRQIAVEEAAARLESAKLDAQAEIETAKGVAEANVIIGTSLKNNPEYLLWRWIEGLHDANAETIYVATEANLPILEAGRFLLSPQSD